MLASAPLDEAEEIGEEVEILVVMFSDLWHARAKVVSRLPPHAICCPVERLTCCSGCSATRCSRIEQRPSYSLTSARSAMPALHHARHRATFRPAAKRIAADPEHGRPSEAVRSSNGGRSHREGRFSI